MLTSLTELLDKQELRPQLITDCEALIETQINNKKGLMGMAINKGFAGVSRLKDGRMITQVVDYLLDDFIMALEPYYQSYCQMDSQSRGDFADFLIIQDEAVSASLLAVTDRKRELSNNRMLTTIYDKMRKLAQKNVKEAIPDLGRLIQTYAGVE